MSIFQFKIFKDSIHYKIVFLIWALIDTLTVGQKITKYFSTVLIIWGVILIIQNIINNTRKINRVTLVAIIGFVLVTHTDNKTNEKDEASKNIVYSKCEFTALEDVILSNNTKFKNAKKAYDKERKMFTKMIKKRAK